MPFGADGRLGYDAPPFPILLVLTHARPRRRIWRSSQNLYFPRTQANKEEADAPSADAWHEGYDHYDWGDDRG